LKAGAEILKLLNQVEILVGQAEDSLRELDHSGSRALPGKHTYFIVGIYSSRW